MSTRTRYLSRYPMLGPDAATRIGLMIQECQFQSDIPAVEPASNGASWPGPITFGHEGIWNPAEHGLTVQVEILFSPAILFGLQGVGCTNASLAIAMEWVANESRQRGTSRPVEVRRGTGRTHASFSITFEPGQIRGNVHLGLNAYVMSPDPEPADRECHLANTPGLFLGSLGSPCILAFDGEASLFPVIEFAGTQKDPLWRIRYEATDPCEDPFAPPYIALEINSRHPDYPSYCGDEPNSASTPLERQIVSSWMAAFLMILKEKAPEIYAAAGRGIAFEYRQGSIAHFAEYLLSTFPINTENIAHMLTTVQKTVESKYQNG